MVSLLRWPTFWRERDAKCHEAEEHCKRQRADFQIKTLTDLQDALCRIMKSVYPLADIDYHETFSGVKRDVRKFRRLWKEWQDALSASMVCSARVPDAKIRAAVDGILKLATSLAFPIRRKGDV